MASREPSATEIGLDRLRFLVAAVGVTCGGGLLLAAPAPALTVNLGGRAVVLEPSGVVTDQTVVVEVAPGGPRVTKAPRIAFAALGTDDRVTITPDGLEGVTDGSEVIEPRDGGSVLLPAPADAPGRCAATRPATMTKPPPPKPIDPETNNSWRNAALAWLAEQEARPIAHTADIVLVGDAYFVRANKGPTGAVRRIIALANVVDAITRKQLGLALRLSAVIVWTDPESEPAIFRQRHADIGQLLDRFAVWSVSDEAPAQVKDSAAAQILSGRRFGGGPIGLAWIGTPCRPAHKTSAAAIGVFDRNIYTASILMAHELGHTFGGLHDTDKPCRGTASNQIMQPTISSRLRRRFSDCSRTWIEPNLDAAECLR